MVSYLFIFASQIRHMKIFFSFIAGLAVLLLLSCKNSNNESKTLKAHADSLMDDIMGNHGASMAKMNKISVAQALIKKSIDSIGKLPEKAKKETSVYKNELDSMLVQLNNSESSMNQWMDEFNIDSLQSNLKGRIQYLESEKQKVIKVKDDMISSLQKADSLLGKKIKR